MTRPARAARARAALTGATDWVNALAFGPAGHTLAAGSSDDSTIAWNLATGSVIFRLPHPEPVTSLAWDGARTLITGAADGTVRVWSVPPPVLLAHGSVNSVAFGPGGRALVAGATDLERWDVAGRTETGAASVPGGGTFVNAVASSPRGGTLAAGYGDGSVRLWRLAAGGGLAPLGRPLRASAMGPVEFAAFRRDGRVLATAGQDGTVRLWNLADPSRPLALATIRDSATYVFSAVFSPDGRVLAAGSADRTVRLWNVSSPARPVPLGKPLTGPHSYVYSLAFSPDGRVLAAGSADETIRLWNVADPARPVPLGRPLTGPGGYVYSLVFSPDGRMLAGGITDGSVWLWRTSGASPPVHRADLTGPEGHVYSVAFGPRGHVLAAGSADGTVRLWGTRAGAAAAAVCVRWAVIRFAVRTGANTSRACPTPGPAAAANPPVAGPVGERRATPGARGPGPISALVLPRR